MEKRSEYIKCSIRTEAKDGKKLVLRGYPILFNTETTIYDFWYGEIRETILPTALDNTRLDDVYLLVGHNADNVLGKVGANMRVETDETGLFFECELPNTQLARDWYNLIESGIVDGMSFGFTCSDDVNMNTMKRTITSIDELYEVTITPFPAYKEASVIAQRERKIKEDEKRAIEAEEQQKHAAELAEEQKKQLDESIKKLEAL